MDGSIYSIFYLISIPTDMELIQTGLLFSLHEGNKVKENKVKVSNFF